MIKTRFRNNQEQISNFIDTDVLFITRNYSLEEIYILIELEKRKAITDLLLDWGDNQDSDKEMNIIFPEGKPFDYPKPSLLVKNIIKSLEFKDNDDFIVLDSFAGSGTTAEAVLALNNEDKLDRSLYLLKWKILL